MVSVTDFDDPVEQQIWATLRALNDAWTQGHADDLVDYFHPRMVAVTPVDRHRVEGGAACVAGWKGFADRARIQRWQEIDPLINVYGDCAVVAYDFEMAFEIDGQTVELGGRDLFFFVREDGKWWAVADQYSPYPR